MCGRFALGSSIKHLAEALEAASVKITEDRSRYNIAPTQSVVAVRDTGDERELTSLKWGLVPSWAKDPAMGARMINARSETVTEKPSFREAFRRRRCLIPATGFYEWKREGGRKQPYYFRMRTDEVFAFAGLWERWEGASNDDDGGGGAVLETCSILTTAANEVLAPVHDRMPVIIAPEDYGLWLAAKTEMLTELLRPFAADKMTSHPVSPSVNSPAYDHADLVAPLLNSA